MQTINQLVEEINKEFVEVVGGSFIHTETGEMFTGTEVKKYVQRKIEQYNIEHMRKVNMTALKEFDIIPEQNITNKRSKQNLKKKKSPKSNYDGGEFNMAYRNRLEAMSNMKLDNNEKLVYYVLRDFISYPSNSVKINDEIPKFTDLENIVGLKERTIRKALKSLEERGVIKLKQEGYRKAIIVNPEYYASGKDLNTDILQMFGLVDCDDKVESYIN